MDIEEISKKKYAVQIQSDKTGNIKLPVVAKNSESLPEVLSQNDNIEKTKKIL